MQHGLTFCEHTGLFICHSTTDRDRLGRDAYNRLKEAEAELRTAELALDIRGEV